MHRSGKECRNRRHEETTQRPVQVRSSEWEVMLPGGLVVRRKTTTYTENGYRQRSQDGDRWELLMGLLTLLWNALMLGLAVAGAWPTLQPVVQPVVQPTLTVLVIMIRLRLQFPFG